MNNKPLHIYIFCCSSTFDPMELARRFDSRNEHHLKVIPLPCSGKLDILYLIKAFETGVDGVAVVTCKEGECRYLEGNLRAKKRAESVVLLLDEIGMGKGRTTIIQIKDGGIEQVIRELDNFQAELKDLSSIDSGASIQTPLTR